MMGTGTVKVPVPGIFHLFGGIGTGIGKKWYWNKVSEPVSVKFGIGKKSRNRYRKNLVPVSVSEIFGTGIKYRYRYRLKFWVPSHTGMELSEHYVQHKYPYISVCSENTILNICGTFPTA